MTKVLHPAAALAALVAGSAAAQSRYNFPPTVTSIGREIHWLHDYVMVWCVAIGLFVFAWMLYAAFKYRKSSGHQAEQFHESTTVEIVWTVIPFLIVIALAVPATKTVVAMKDTSNAELTIKAVGQQWKWGYEYLKGEGEGISLLSTLSTPREQIDGDTAAAKEARLRNANYLREVDQPLVVPADTKVRVITTANDVIHSWFVPAFGVKQDAIPGFVRDTWFRAEQPGTYRGQCAELCGKDHAFMPIVVKVVSKDEYRQWVAQTRTAQGLDQPTRTAALAPAGPAPLKDEDAKKTWALADLASAGEKIFNGNCAQCHQADGKGIPGSFPALDGSKVVQGPPPQQIGVLLHGIVKNGTPTAMVSFASRLNDLEIAEVITYTKNAWGNKTGQVVQPRDVAALRTK